MEHLNRCFRYLRMGLPEDIARLNAYGDFDGAIRLIDQMLERRDIPDEMRRNLTVRKEIMRRLPDNYPVNLTQALEEIREVLPGFTAEELDRYLDDGKIDWIFVKGEKHLPDRFVSSLKISEPAFWENGIDPDNEVLNAAMRKMKEKGSMSLSLRIRAELRIEDDAFTPGMHVRVHLPIPSECDTQSNIEIVSSSPDGAVIDPGDAPARTVCWDRTLQENTPFVVEYRYVHTEYYHDTEHYRADETQPDFCTEEEEPHITFTPYIRALADHIVGDTKDPLEKARKIYDYITLNMRYSYMPEYFVMEHIPERCARSFMGDCGVFALLFITLCRYCGIPAQWQSGNTAGPDDSGSHDWARFYIAPYGWLFADPSFGVSAHRKKNEERRRFYFGNLDPYRMVANNAFQAPFLMEKQFWRMDPYDSQSGEIETDTRCMNDSEYHRTKTLLECTER